MPHRVIPQLIAARGERPNVAFGAPDAPNVALGAWDAPNVALGRKRAGAGERPNVALGALNAPKGPFGALNATKAALGRASGALDAFQKLVQEPARLRGRAIRVALGDRLGEAFVTDLRCVVHARRDGRRRRDARRDDLGQAAVELGEQAVVPGADHRRVELGVGVGEVLPASLAQLRLAAGQQRPQLRHLLLGARQRGEPSSLGLESAPDLQDFAQLRAAEPADRAGHLAGGAHVSAVALADFEQARVRERAHGFADGVASDAELLAELGFGGDAFAEGPLALRDRRAQLLDDLVDQAGPAGGGQRHRIIPSSNHPTYAIVAVMRV